MNFIRKLVKSKTKQEEDFYSDLKNVLNFSPKTLEYYQKAFTHRSLKKIDKNGDPLNYERLEFLGDAMLGSIIASYLYKKSANRYRRLFNTNAF